MTSSATMDGWRYSPNKWFYDSKLTSDFWKGSYSTAGYEGTPMAITDLDELLTENKTALEKRRLAAEIQAHEATRDYTELRYQELQYQMEDQGASNDENRFHTIDGEVNQRESATFIYNLGKWSRQSKKPITVAINSPGGYVTEGLAMYDFAQMLRNQGIKLTTVALGEAASMGGILLQMGDKRVMTPSSWLLIHEVSGGSFGKTSELKDDLKFQERLQDLCLGILASRSTLSKAQIKKRWVKKDWWLSADEALNLGFIDEVGYAGAPKK